MQFVQFPNGRVWILGKNATIQGTVRVPGYLAFHDLESHMDAISEAATDSIVGLSDFTYEYRGGEMVHFCGTAEDLVRPEGQEEEDRQYHILTTSTNADELRGALRDQYGLSDADVSHALASLGADYGAECSIPIFGSAREIRCPAYPEACHYVRIVVDGLEICYWNHDEWQSDPEDVIGAVIGAAKGGVRGCTATLAG